MKTMGKPVNPSVVGQRFDIGQQTATEIAPKTRSLLIVKPESLLQISQSI